MSHIYLTSNGHKSKRAANKSRPGLGPRMKQARPSSDEERMALAVLVQGVKDIIENNQKYVDFYDPEWGTVKAVDNALAFFADKGVDIGTYTWYCQVIGIDPAHIRAAIDTGDWEALTAFSKVNVH